MAHGRVSSYPSGSVARGSSGGASRLAAMSATMRPSRRLAAVPMGVFESGVTNAVFVVRAPFRGVATRRRAVTVRLRSILGTGAVQLTMPRSSGHPDTATDRASCPRPHR